MNEKELLVLQERVARQIGHKVDVYHNEKHRVVGVAHHDLPPTPATLIQLINY